MGALDRIKQADEQQKTTELLENLISQHDADMQQIAQLTKTVADLTERHGAWLHVDATQMAGKLPLSFPPRCRSTPRRRSG